MQDTIASHTFFINEQELVKRAQANDQEAFERLYEYYFPKIYGYVIKRVGAVEVAEDIVSSVFMKVFTKMNGYSDQGYTFGAWIYKIATNSLIDYYRKNAKQKQVNLENAYNISEKTQSIEDYVDASREIQRIKRVLNKIPNKHQEILHLRFFAELSNQEISQTLGISAENTRVRLHRAMKLFKKTFEKYVQ